MCYNDIIDIQLKRWLIIFISFIIFVFIFPPNEVRRYNEAIHINPKPRTTSTNPIINKLIQCESEGRWDIKILDVNNRYSYGGLQFQLSTFWKFGKAYKILSDDIELSEAENLIYDSDIQIKIAEKMFEDELQYHWMNCYNKIKNTL